MKWKLIIMLSLAAIIIAVPGVFVNIEGFELWLWLLLYAVYAIIIAKNATEKKFLHGFLAALLGSIWTMIIHLAFFDTYMKTYADAFAEVPEGMNLKTVIAGASLVMGLLSGVIAGLFAWVGGKMVKKSP